MNVASADKTFVITCNFYTRQVFIPQLVRLLRHTAPNVRLGITTSFARGDEQLKKSGADLQIGALLPKDAGFRSRTLLEEYYVCVMDRNNPLAQGESVDRDSYLAAHHLAITSYDRNWQSSLLKAIEAEKIKLSQPVTSPSLAGISELIRGIDLLATVPSRISASIGGDLFITKSPLPAPFPIHMVWTERTQDAASHIWLRRQIVRIARGIKDI